MYAQATERIINEELRRLGPVSLVPRGGEDANPQGDIAVLHAFHRDGRRTDNLSLPVNGFKHDIQEGCVSDFLEFDGKTGAARNNVLRNEGVLDLCVVYDSEKDGEVRLGVGAKAEPFCSKHGSVVRRFFGATIRMWLILCPMEAYMRPSGSY